jgi:hypothetical protein
MADETRVGRAYAFFDCDASKEQIEEAMPDIRRNVRISEGLQLLLQEGISGLELDAKLAECLRFPDDYRVMSSERFKQRGEAERVPLDSLRYAMTADYAGATNEDAAGELGDVMNAIHLSCNRDQGLFRGAVVYEKDGEYHLRE